MKWLILLSSVVFVGFLFMNPLLPLGQTEELAKATFVVKWYDVGVAALEGRPGVELVKKGWLGSREINRVIYDPKKISVEEMENALKINGTYVETVTKSQ